MNLEQKKLTKKEILSFIKEKRAVSFVELQQEFEGTTGDIAIVTKKNIVLWEGLSTKLAKTIRELIDEKKIKYNSSCMTLISYLSDGAILKYPLAKQNREYKKPHWLPVVMDPA